MYKPVRPILLLVLLAAVGLLYVRLLKTGSFLSSTDNTNIMTSSEGDHDSRLSPGSSNGDYQNFEHYNYGLDESLSNNSPTEYGDNYQSFQRSNDHAEATSLDEQKKFCMMPAMPMAMFMDGFRRSLFTKEPSPTCLVYYFRSWTLDNVRQFQGALVCATLLAILTEGLSTLRAITLRNISRGLLRRMLLTFIYTAQQLMGYVIMLTAMMYSVEMLLAVVIGLVLGNLIFSRAAEANNQHNRRLTQNRRSSSFQQTHSTRCPSPVTQLPPSDPLHQKLIHQGNTTSDFSIETENVI